MGACFVRLLVVSVFGGRFGLDGFWLAGLTCLSDTSDRGGCVDSPLMVSKAEAAAMLKASERTVDRLRAAGVLSPRLDHGRLLFPVAEVLSVEAQRAATSRLGQDR